MTRYKPPTVRFLEAAEKTGDIMLRYWYQRQMILDNLLSDQEIDRIADRVIQRISITADTSEVIAAFDEIDNRIKNLGG